MIDFAALALVSSRGPAKSSSLGGTVLPPRTVFTPFASTGEENPLSVQARTV